MSRVLSILGLVMGLLALVTVLVGLWIQYVYYGSTEDTTREADFERILVPPPQHWFVFDPGYQGHQPNVYRDFGTLCQDLERGHGTRVLEFVFRPGQLSLDVPRGLYNMEHVRWFTAGVPSGVRDPTRDVPTVHLLDGTHLRHLAWIEGPMRIQSWTDETPVMTRDHQNVNVTAQAAVHLRIHQTWLDNRGRAPFVRVAPGNELVLQLAQRAQLTSHDTAPAIQVDASAALTVVVEDTTTRVAPNAIHPHELANVQWQRLSDAPNSRGTSNKEHLDNLEDMP